MNNQPHIKPLQLPEILHHKKVVLNEDEEEGTEMQEEIQVQEISPNAEDKEKGDLENGDFEEA